MTVRFLVKKGRAHTSTAFRLLQNHDRITLLNKGSGIKFSKLTIRDVSVDDKTVMLRADYNVPLGDDGDISDDLRIKTSLDTINYLLDRNCKVVIISHLGRPDGKYNKDYSLKPVAKRLEELLKKPVKFVQDCVGDKVVQAVKKARLGDVLLLENLRFHAEEEANDDDFAKKLVKSSGAKYFVQDGFGVVHRAHSSTDKITQHIPSVAGLLLEKECVKIGGAMKHPDRPFVAVVGGAKVKDKIGIIKEFIKIADHIIIGGAMANTFLAYKGKDMGSSEFEPDQKHTLDELYKMVKHKGGDGSDGFILLPSDVAVAKKIDESAKRRNVSVSELLPDDIALDIGDESIERMVHVINNAKTVVWNGTLGYAELSEFAHGSARLALALAIQDKTVSIIGGGDTADFVLKWDGEEGKRFSHISTGGGASLQLMSGEKLPGVESLLDTYK